MIKCSFENGHQALLRHITMVAIIVRDHKILLVKRAAHSLEGNKYALPGGYMNRDETLAQGIAREVHEETGYETASSKLFRIVDNPNRTHEDTQNVDFVFVLEIGEKTGKSDDEIQETKWFPLDQLPSDDEMAFDHLESLRAYLATLQNS